MFSVKQILHSISLYVASCAEASSGADVAPETPSHRYFRGRASVGRGGSVWGAVAQWLERATDNRVVAGWNPAEAVWKLGNFLYPWPTLPVSFGRDTKSRWSLLSGVYARGSKRPHQSALEMCNCRGLHYPP